ncbi:hypothetical protein FQA47_023469 [Oryzias melastigma]|uniref:G-protein coupled receptors family 1 profile domain-containing protein n=1 Tax=Oryzias melastigma TaxID=30732 RepID=A0A834BV28_ORYME|nr:hypothetical protein FQA47_023469 [Oryzias melastigma]
MLYVLLSLLVPWLLLAPLFIYILVMGFQRWRKERLKSSSTPWSHMDVFTYNIAVLELFWVLASFLVFVAFCTHQLDLFRAANGIFCFALPGETLFHFLTCLERYLAVVHPVTYRRLRQARGVRIRNITVACVWMICFLMSVTVWTGSFAFVNNALVFFISVTFCFCSASVLWVLIRPGPGEEGRSSDPTKHRAFYTMVVVTGALSLKFLSMFFAFIMQRFAENNIFFCLSEWSALWLSLPSSLVLPLLFLKKAGKLRFCSLKTDRAG